MDKLVQNFQGVGATIGLESMRVSLENGLKGISINGVAFVADPTQDSMIKKYNDNGTKWHLPHRVILVSKDNMLVGVPDESTWGTFDIFYDKVTKKVYVDMADQIDTMWGQDSTVMMAF